MSAEIHFHGHYFYLIILLLLSISLFHQSNSTKHFLSICCVGEKNVSLNELEVGYMYTCNRILIRIWVHGQLLTCPYFSSTTICHRHFVYSHQSNFFLSKSFY